VLDVSDQDRFATGSCSRAEVVGSVCTGAFLLTEAGLLDGVEATTHSVSIEASVRQTTRRA
jgi:transcriptional regulator GlxA family with amidase domain